MTDTIKLILTLVIGAGVAAGGYVVYQQTVTVEVPVPSVAAVPATPAPPAVVYVLPAPGNKIPAGDIRAIPRVRY